MIRTLGSAFRVFAAFFTQLTSISAGTRRKYLSNFLAMLVIFAGMQSSSPAHANASLYTHENPPTQSAAIASLDACVAAINNSRFTRATLPNLLFLTDETALVNAITAGYIKVTVLTSSTLFDPHTGKTDLICGNHLDNNVNVMDSYNPGQGAAAWESNTGAGPYSTMTKRGRDFFFGGAGNDTVHTLYESFFWGGPGTDSQGPGWPTLGLTSQDTVQRTGTFNEGGHFFEQGAELPGAPTIGTPYLSASTSVTVPFTAPGSNGGSAITSYTAVSTPGSITASVNQSGSGSITVTGLSGNTSYTFKVYASNIEGAGANSSSSASVSTPLSVACSGGGTFTIQNNVVTSSDLTCAGAVNIPDGVTSIADNAFFRLGKTLAEQQRITSVTIPNSVITIGAGAFQDNRNASSLTIGTAVTSIGASAFNNFLGLTTLVIPGSVTSISSWAFANIPLTSLTLNEGLLTIGEAAFLGNKLTTLAIPNSVTTISSEGAFGYGLYQSLTLGSGLTTIGNRTFEVTTSYLQSLTIPPGVTTLGTNAFKNYAGSTYTYCGTSLTATVLNSAGLTGKTKTCPLTQTITRTSVSPTSPVKSGTYTPAANASSGLPVAITIATGSSSVCSISAGVVTFNTVGSCVIEYSQSGNASYSAATPVTETLTIGKATPTFLAWSGVSKNYGDSAFTVTAPTVTGSLPGSFTYSSATTSVISVSGSTLTVVGVGSSGITATFTPNDTTNYNSATTTMTVTVGKATPTFSTWSAVSKNYGDSAFTVTAPTVTGSLPGNFTYSSGTTSVISVSGTTLTVVGAGSSIITATFTPTDLTNYIATTINMTVTVGKANQATLSVANQSFWAHQNQTPSLWIPTGGSGTGALQYSVISGPCTISSGTLYGNPTGPSGPKVCTLTVTKAADTNYNAITSASFTATMAFSFNKVGLALPSAATTATYRTPVVITATSFGTIPGTISFRAAGQLISGCTNKSVTASPWTATCTWTPSASGETLLTYDWTPEDPDLYDTKTNWTPYRLATDPLGTTTPVTITVAKAVLSITASSHSVAYGAAVPTITPTYSGFVNGEDSTVLLTVPTCSTTYTTTTAVGTIGSSCSGATAANYSFSYTAGLITITQGGQTSALTVSSTIATYGSTLSLITSGGDGSGANSFVVDSGPCTVSGSTLTPTAVGTCMVTATKAASGNYLAASSTSTAITVGKATPTFSNFANVSKTYGAASFSLTTPTSSTPGDWIYSSATTSVASINGSTVTIAGFGTSLVTATFTPTDSSNYFSNGTTTMTISVSKALLSITASSHTAAFGDAVPEITPSYSGFVNSEDSSVLLTTPICSTAYTTTTAVGTVGSSCSGATAANYSFSYTAGVITITQGGQTSVLVITTTTVTYGSTLSLLTSGGNGSGANSFTINSGPCSVLDSTLTSTAVGTCMVTATKAANGNYLAASSVSTAITVTPKGLTVSGLTGVNKEFDRSLTGTVTGSPTLVGVVGSDNVLLGGTPTFTFASANAANGITITASGYTLTGTTAGNYTLTQPTVTANITAKAARVAATNTTVAFGAPVTSGVTASGLISPDALGSASYTYSGTGTSTPPTAVGVYTVTPSNAVLSTGTIGNYTISYDTASLTILAKYTITYNANGGVIGSSSTTSADFVVGDTALALPTPTREGFNFLGWFTLQSNGVQVTGAYTPSATATLWAHWIQKSLVGVGNSQKIGTITTLANVGNTYSATSTSGTVAVTYVANALPVGTVIDIYQMADSSRASSMISSTDQYVLSLVIAWLTPTNTVPVLSSNDALTMVITDSAIKKGAKVYSLVGNDSTLLGTATADGSVTVQILEDPEVYIAISKPDAPTGVSATTGGSRSSTVSWIVPSTDGGSTIDLYTVTSNRGQTCTSVTTSCSVTGLSDATTYTFTVTARNSVGTSASSAPSAAILTEDTAGLALAAQQAADARVAAAALAAQQTAAALAAQQAAAALAAQQAAAARVPAAALVSTPVVMITPTLTSLTFVENATKDGGKLIWTGTNIESVLFTGFASTYPQPFNYGAFTITWTGELVNMVAGVTYTMKLEARSSTGGSASKIIEYTIAKPVLDTSTADVSLKAAQEKAAAEKKAADEAAVAALKIAQDKAAADKKAAEEAAAAALKIAQEKALAEAKAASDAAALKIAQEKAAAEAKAAADAAALKIAQDKAAADAAALKIAQDKAAAEAAALKIAQEKAAAEKKAAEEAAALKVAQDKAAAEAKAAADAAALKIAEEKAAADAAALVLAKKTPILNLFTSSLTAKYTSIQMAKMKKLTLKLEPATTLKCVGYINTKGTTATKAKATALAQAKATCASAKKLNPKITTVVTTATVTKAPKPLVGASNVKAKYRVDLFAYKG